MARGFAAAETGFCRVKPSRISIATFLMGFLGNPTKSPPTKRPRLQNVLPTKRPSTKRPFTKRSAFKTSMDTKRPHLQNVLAYKMSSYGGEGDGRRLGLAPNPTFNLRHIN